MKEFHVLGLAKSIKKYSNPNNCLTIGVNDIWKYYKTDYLLVLDKVKTFEPDRFDTIIHSRPKQFFTIWNEWSKFIPITFIEIDNAKPGRGGLLDNLDNGLLPFHVDTTFTAVCIAYRFLRNYNGVGKIVMFGCQFTEHEKLKKFIPVIQECYKALFNELKKRYITLYNADKKSALNKILPFYQTT